MPIILTIGRTTYEWFYIGTVIVERYIRYTLDLFKEIHLLCRQIGGVTHLQIGRTIAHFETNPGLVFVRYFTWYTFVLLSFILIDGNLGRRGGRGL